MASEIRNLKLRARRLGVSGIRSMSRSELEDAIAEAEESDNGTRGRKRSSSVVKKATRPVKAKRSPAAKKAAKRSTTAHRGPGRPRKEETTTKKRGRPPKAEQPKRRGRPPGSGTKKATKAVAKRSNALGRPVGTGTGTRTPLPDRINWKHKWSFREGSTADYIWQQILKSTEKYKDTEDIREDAIEKLWNKVGKVEALTFLTRDGEEKDEDAAWTYLRYRVFRAIFDYAVNTGQHEGAGTGDYMRKGNGDGATTTKKRGRPAGAKKAGRPRKVEEDDEYDEDEDEDEEPTPKRRGRPPKRRP